MHSPAPSAAESERLLFLIPVFNDWEALSLLLGLLDRTLREQGWMAEMVLIDDGSSMSPTGVLNTAGLLQFRRIEILELARNLGHQRAIAIGLAWLNEHRRGYRIVLMDCDGEDNPNDVPALVKTARDHPDQQVVFAARTRRSEDWVFQVFYRLYQVLHLLLTGHGVKVGNFSVISPAAVPRIAVMSETWSHYAAAVFVSRIPYMLVPTVRARRLVGRSRMNFTALVVHGLSAVSVFSPIIGVRLLITWTVLSALTGGLLVALIGATILSGEVPGWLSSLLALILFVLLQQFSFGLLFVLLVLGSRQGNAFLPARDYRYFIHRVVSVCAL